MTSSRTSSIMAEKKLNGRFIAIFSLHFNFKGGGVCNLSSPASALTFTCGRDNLKSFSCILPKFVTHVTNDQFSYKFQNGWKKFKMADLLRFFDFYVNNLTLSWKVFHVSSSNLLCMLLISSSRTSSIMAEKEIKMADLLRFFDFYVNNLTLTWKVFHVSSSNLLCMLLISSSRTSSIMAEKKIKMADLLWFYPFHVNNLTLWGR